RRNTRSILDWSSDLCSSDLDAETMMYMRNRLPENANWSAFGIGRMQMPIVAQAAMLGGNVRVGLEDNLYLKKGVLATNAQLVDRSEECRVGSNVILCMVQCI